MIISLREFSRRRSRSRGPRSAPPPVASEGEAQGCHPGDPPRITATCFLTRRSPDALLGRRLLCALCKQDLRFYSHLHKTSAPIRQGGAKDRGCRRTWRPRRWARTPPGGLDGHARRAPVRGVGVPLCCRRQGSHALTHLLARPAGGSALGQGPRSGHPATARDLRPRFSFL